jgi:hypothetical protein
MCHHHLGLLVILDILDREGGAVLMTIGGNVIRKEFKGTNPIQHISGLVKIYKLLKKKGVPHVNTLFSSNLESNPPHIYLSLVGDDRLPTSGSEAFNAVVCVLKALKVHYDVSVSTI